MREKDMDKIKTLVYKIIREEIDEYRREQSNRERHKEAFEALTERGVLEEDISREFGWGDTGLVKAYEGWTRIERLLRSVESPDVPF